MGISATSPLPPAATRTPPDSPSRGSLLRESPTASSRSGATCFSEPTRWACSCPAIRSWRRRRNPESRAYDLILGDAGKVFDLSQEEDELRLLATAAQPSVSRASLLAAWSKRGEIRHHQLWRMGHPQGSLPVRCAASCPNWTREWVL